MAREPGDVAAIEAVGGEFWGGFRADSPPMREEMDMLPAPGRFGPRLGSSLFPTNDVLLPLCALEI